MTPLPVERLQEIEDFIAGMRPLLPDVAIQHRIVEPDQVKGMLAPKAPHYLVISGVPSPHRDLCAGFLFQQLDLYLSAMGIGACWLGATKGREAAGDDEDILAICFGMPVGSVTRTADEFKRKSLDEIVTGAPDSRLEAARLAPSGRNLQPWHFIAQDGAIYVYQAIPGKVWGRLYGLDVLDVGIALCHLALASEAAGQDFHFTPDRAGAPEAPKGFVYVGVVE